MALLTNNDTIAQVIESILEVLFQNGLQDKNKAS